MLLRNARFVVWILLALTGLVLAAGQVSAGESPWVVTAGFGQANSDWKSGSRHTRTFDDEDDAVSVSLGYAVNSHLGIQVGYHDLGRHRGFGSPCRERDDSCIERLASFGLCIEGFDCSEVLVGLDAELSGVSLAAVPRWPVTERFSATGKVGVMAWNGEISGAEGFGRIEGLDGAELLIGIGLHYEFPTGLGVSLEHDAVDLDVSSTLIGVSWRF